MSQVDNYINSQILFGMKIGYEMGYMAGIYTKVSETPYYRTIQIHELIEKHLVSPLYVHVEMEESEYTAKVPHLPVYGCGASVHEAINVLQGEIEDLFDELHEDDNLTKDWVNIRDYLDDKIIQNGQR